MKLEPPADMRNWANTAYQMFIAMTDAGFTKTQALRYLAYWMASSSSIPDDNEDPT